MLIQIRPKAHPAYRSLHILGPLSMSLATGLAAVGTSSSPSALNSVTFGTWLTFSIGVDCEVCGS